MRSLRTTLTTTLWFIALQTLAWYLMILVAKPYLDNYGDMVEVFAWSQHLLMGSDKHPQFLPWIAHFWFLALPRTVASFYGLAALNLGASLLGIYALGRAFGLPKRRVLAAVALEALAFPYLTLPDKLNMNAICLSTWPWVAWAFTRALRDERTQARWLYGALFGVLAAVAMMSKYYSALLLASLLLASLLPGNRSCWRGLAPWLGLATFAITLAPHLVWQTHHHWETLFYADDQGHGFDLHYFLSFALLPIYYWIIPWPLGLALFYRGPFHRRFLRSLRWQGPGDLLWVFSFGPYLLSLFAGLIGFVHLSEPWGIPIGFAFTLLWLRNADAGAATRETQLLGAFRFLWPAMVLLGAVFAIGAGRSGSEALYYPEQAAARQIDAEWQRLAPGERLAWAAWHNDGARIAYFSDLPYRVEALPAMPDQLPDYYPPRPDWQKEGGVVFCPLGPGTDTAAETDCTRFAEAWSAAHGNALTPYRFALARHGLYFPLDRPYAFAAFFYRPQ